METLKDLVKDGKATFSHAIAGVLYYKLETPVGNYQFPIDMNDRDDVGTTTFVAEYKAITLMRYIRKAMESENLIKIL
jgi:hypothetical protein